VIVRQAFGSGEDVREPVWKFLLLCVERKIFLKPTEEQKNQETKANKVHHGLPTWKEDGDPQGGGRHPCSSDVQGAALIMTCSNLQNCFCQTKVVACVVAPSFFLLCCAILRSLFSSCSKRFTRRTGRTLIQNNCCRHLRLPQTYRLHGQTCNPTGWPPTPCTDEQIRRLFSRHKSEKSLMGCLRHGAVSRADAEAQAVITARIRLSTITPA
jgi:hypothetical protein